MYSEWQKRYEKENTETRTLRFNKKTDEDILRYIKPIKNFQGFIKNLIRKEIGKHYD